MKNIIIFDTTLRDGEQSPGATMNKEDKILIAQHLAEMGVNVIEAGFPAASQGDYDSVKAVAQQIQNSTICGLARATESDIDRTGEALKQAQNKRIHTFIATSPIHMEKKLRMSKHEVYERAIQAIKWSKKWTTDIEFSAEDAFRSEPDFLYKVIEGVIKQGATTINLPDTVGYATPFEYGAFIKNIIENVPNSDKAIFSAHCHDDLGMAVSNSLSAVLNGALQIECTINGIGERAGNAALEEIVMALKTRKDLFQASTAIDTQKILATSRLVSSITGFKVQKNKAIVGENAFAHESGIHQDGILKHRETYEVMNAQDIGWESNTLILGKHSGRAALKQRLADLGYTIENDEPLNNILHKIKKIAEQKTVIQDNDILALL